MTLFCRFVLCGCRHGRSAAVVQWFVRFSAHPQVMQQHRQLSCGGDDRSLLPALPAAFGQPQSPASQVAIDAEWSQDVLRSLHQQRFVSISCTVPELGSGNEYNGSLSSQQITYPELSGVAGVQVDLGASGTAPELDVEAQRFVFSHCIWSS